MAVVIDFSKYLHHVVEIDAETRLGHVQPGCVLDHFRETAKKQAGLFFGPDPATHSRCTIGGMLGNNSCGSHSLLSKKHGFGVRMSDNTHSLDVLLYDGTRMHVGPTPPEELEAIIRGGGRHGEIYAALKSFVERYGDVIRESSRSSSAAFLDTTWTICFRKMASMSPVRWWDRNRRWSRFSKRLSIWSPSPDRLAPSRCWVSKTSTPRPNAARKC